MDTALASKLVARIDSSSVDGCWLWTGTVTIHGYGQVCHEGVSYAVHRLAWELAHGEPIPAGMQVCHSCDVRLCARPSHLWLGTSAENQRDKGRKGRAAKGVRNGGGGKLTEADVLAIRAGLAAGASRAELGRRFGVSRTEIYFIATGQHWSHV